MTNSSQRTERKKQADREWYLANKERILERNRQRRLDNPELARKKDKATRQRTKEIRLDEWRAYHREYGQRYKERQAALRASDPAKELQRKQRKRAKERANIEAKRRKNERRNQRRKEDAEWRAAQNEATKRKRNSNPQFMEWSRQYWHRRAKQNPAVVMRMTLATRLSRAIREQCGEKSARTMELIGCTVAFLRQYLESQFQPGMTWANRGSHGWHIDHKKPCAAFDLRDAAQQQACFHWSNLQPMWASENISKGARFDGTDYRGRKGHGLTL